jgi:hypothetical protein
LRKYFKKINVIFWGHQTWKKFIDFIDFNFFLKEKNLVWNQRLNIFNQKLKKIQYQLFVWQKFSGKWPKNWCLSIHIPNRYILKQKWKEWFKQWKKV